ncbi:transcriptional regulator with XRE-family HTH domain [Rhodococcus sp. LBL1]|nr:transcriptional regulator with XRE-family HTH domain [Rhodococcus sp. LBL1]MDH6682904.1 transcriptional regulator with XRE-family HTH domain [Rhodococcus sp. LBL2]
MTALVRTIRTQQGLTLEALAERTGLTRSYLSKVERGRSTPSIAAALSISRALDVDVSRLFSAAGIEEKVTIERAGERESGADDRYRPVASAMLGKVMTPFVVRPGTEYGDEGYREHPGQEFVFVHAGAVEIDFDGRTTALATGDSVYFDATVPHRMRALGDEPAEAVVVVYDDPAARRG